MSERSKNSRTVLVLDGNQRSALATTRAVGKFDSLWVITADETPSSLAGSSRFSRQNLQYPSPKSDPAGFISWLEETVSQRGIELLLPMTEISSQLILLHRNAFPSVKIPFADYEKVIQVADKANLVLLAKKLGIPVPKSEIYERLEEVSFETLQFPCVIKPAFSHYLEDKTWTSTEVCVANNHEDFAEIFEKQPFLRTHKFLVQEFIPGHGAGLFCYYANGEAKVFFCHSRVREKPPTGGVSVLSESAEIDSKQLKLVKALLDEISWHGVAMVEFRVNSDGTPYLMEINTRFWGSLQLAIDSGVDFPGWVVATEFNLPMPMRPTYKVGQQLRWLLGDIDGLYIYLKSPRNSIMKKIVRVFQFLKPKFLRRKHEVNRIGDFGPAIYELRAYIKEFFVK